jgi:hypothetical protein
MENDIAYHNERALVELDLGYAAENYQVAEAHLKLSSLHLERAEAIRQTLQQDRHSIVRSL